ncbi:MAG: hypothetical protein V3T88_09050, partial [Nitrosomonadaceae bacterium]
MISFLSEVQPVKMSGSYIYYLLDKGAVVYVGQTRSVSLRMVNHVAQRKKVFDSYKLLEVKDGLNMNQREFFQILQYRPKYNKTLPRVDFLTPKTTVITGYKRALKKGLAHKYKFNVHEPDFTINLYESTIEYWKTPGYTKEIELL